MLECVANVSEGRDRSAAPTRSRAACGAALARRAHRRRPPPLGVHARRPGRAAMPRPRPPRWHRPSAEPRLDLPGTPACTRASARSTSCRSSRSTGRRRPRRGRAAAHRRSARGGPRRFAVPVFLYDDADARSRDLPTVRRDAFTTRAPDLGPPAPHPTLGATAVGRAPPARRGQLRARRPTTSRSPARSRGGARARRRPARRACARASGSSVRGVRRCR